MWNVKLSGMASAGTRWKTADLSKMQDKDTTLRQLHETNPGIRGRKEAPEPPREAKYGNKMNKM